jgi:hypothetical protein
MKRFANPNRTPRVRFIANTIAIAFLGVSSVASAVNPHRPVITNITPDFGPVTGGTVVMFEGSNFKPPMTTTFGGVPGTGCTTPAGPPSAQTFTCITPASTVLGRVQLTVKNNANGNSGTLVIPNGFLYTCAACTVSPVSALFEGMSPAGSTEPNGIVEPGETMVAFSPVWFNASGIAFTGNAFTGNLSNPTLPGGTLTIPTAQAQYPNLAAGTDGACTSCYALGASFTAGRPQVHVDATVVETPSINGVPNVADAHTWTVHIGNSFTDIPESYGLYTHIERLVHNEVTFGTGGGLYSPNNTTPRIQMAAFLARSAAGGDGNVPASGAISSTENPVVNGAYDCTGGGTSLYNDVAPTEGFCRYVHYITKLNITSGCNAGVPKPDYCQLTDVTRAVMSVFVARAIVTPGGDALVPDANVGSGTFATRSYDCTSGPAPFTDVEVGTSACKHIGFIWTLGVVDGNGDGTFSPGANVSRGQMAKFLVNAFNLSINKP